MSGVGATSLRSQPLLPIVVEHVRAAREANARYAATGSGRVALRLTTLYEALLAELLALEDAGEKARYAAALAGTGEAAVEHRTRYRAFIADCWTRHPGMAAVDNMLSLALDLLKSAEGVPAPARPLDAALFTLLGGGDAPPP